MDKIFWNSHQYPIVEVNEWRTEGRLEVRPDYQRSSVWSLAAKLMLVDSIFKNFPVPKIYISSSMKNKKPHRVVIDGQQRLTAIFEFIRDEFALAPPYQGDYMGRFFSELGDDAQNLFLRYKIDFNEFPDVQESVAREVYARINKYNVPLNKQELRKADFPGDFLRVADEIAASEIMDNLKMFTIAARRRLLDVEYVSELLAALLSGARNKKDDLDTFYLRYSTWPIEERQGTQDAFFNILGDVETIFSDPLFPIRKTRFKQKSDFYSLFVAISDLLEAGYSLEGKDLADLRNDLSILDNLIAPSSFVPELSEYAIRCVSDANSVSSRLWRKKFLLQFLSGTYKNDLPPTETIYSFLDIQIALGFGDGSSPPTPHVCSVCSTEITQYEDGEVVLAWPSNTSNFQLSNSLLLHTNCYESEQAGNRTCFVPSVWPERSEALVPFNDDAEGY